MTTITALPPAPSRGQAPETFIATADTWVAALPLFGVQANALAGEVNAWAASASSAATAADASADAAEASAGVAATAATTVVNAPGSQATSTTSLPIGNGSKTLTLAQLGKAFVVGQWVYVAGTASPNTQWMHGTVTAYNSTTGVMTVNVLRSAGSATLASWSVLPASPDYDYFTQSGATLVYNSKVQAANSTGALAAASIDNAGFTVAGVEGAGQGAFLRLLRTNSWAAYFGLGPDNKLRFGGASFGAVDYEVWHSGTFNPATKADLSGAVFTGSVTAALFSTSGSYKLSGADTGLVSDATNSYLSAVSNTLWRYKSGTGVACIEFTNSSLTRLGGVYGDNGGFGLLNSTGGWAVKVYTGTSGGELVGNWLTTGSASIGGTVDITGGVFLRSNLVSLNAAGNGWYTVIDRNGGEPVVNAVAANFDQYARASRGIFGYDPNAPGSVGASNWFRSSGATGWFNETYGGGIYMDGPTWVGVYSGKGFAVDNSIRVRVNDTGTAFYTDNTSGGNATQFYVQHSGGAVLLGNSRGGIAFQGTAGFSFNQFMTVTGNIIASGNVTSNSDIRLKKDIAPLRNSLAKLLSLQGFDFTRIADGSRATGVSAQATLLAFPNLVDRDANGILSVNYGGFAAPLIEGMRELHDGVYAELRSVKAALSDAMVRLAILEKP